MLRPEERKGRWIILYLYDRNRMLGLLFLKILKRAKDRDFNFLITFSLDFSI